MQAREFQRRRQRLLRRMRPGNIAILPAAPVRLRNRDVDYPFRQDSDLLYFTGCPEPDAVAVLIPGHPEGEFTLFCQPRDPSAEVWTGRRLGPEGAVEVLGADAAYEVAELDKRMPDLLANKQCLYYTLGRYPTFDQQMMGWLETVRGRSRSGAHAPETIVALDRLVHEMRLYKSPAELKLMRRAARASAAAHRRAMAACRPGLGEHHLDAELWFEFRRNDMVPAYPTIVGSGDNACILHYTENNAALPDNGLVLIDAGAECQGYAADITRTFPVSGRFTAAQRSIYELVLEAQTAAIDAVRPGNSWQAPHEAAVRVLTRGLVDLKILKGKPRDLIKQQAYRRFFLHRTGHWLGLDVHDVGDYQVDGQWRELTPGMTLTVEPGLYIPRDAKGVAKKWRGIGVRIEDDVAVTKAGCEVLTAETPKTVEDVEAWVGSA